jgi:predicted Zn finger-like uncharacterized protein
MRTRTCKDCEGSFIITDNDVGFYVQRGWDLPVRCPQCRKLRRELHANNGIEHVENTDEFFSGRR